MVDNVAVLVHGRARKSWQALTHLGQHSHGGEVGLAPVALIDCAHKVFQPQVSALVERRTCDDKKVEFGETAVGYGVNRVSARAWEPSR